MKPNTNIELHSVIATIAAPTKAAHLGSQKVAGQAEIGGGTAGRANERHRQNSALPSRVM
jgi:hypothetical protein